MINRLLTGEDSVREYAAVGLNGPVYERVYLELRGQVRDVTESHWLLSLEPMVFGWWVPHGSAGKREFKVEEELFSGSACSLYFCRCAASEGEMISREIVARVRLRYAGRLDEERVENGAGADGGGVLILLKQYHTDLYHMSRVRMRLIYWKYFRKPALPYGKFRSLAAAFSYPRQVRVVSSRQGDYYNIFPMDLVGIIPGSGRMVFGLRHSNLSLKAIMETGRLVVAEFPADRKDEVYRLGKHHGAAPPALEDLSFGVISTRDWQFYLPEWVEAYREVSVLETRDLGSHMLIWGAWKEEQRLKPPGGGLFHVHFVHWLHQRRFTNYFTMV